MIYKGPFLAKVQPSNLWGCCWWATLWITAVDIPEILKRKPALVQVHPGDYDGTPEEFAVTVIEFCPGCGSKLDVRP